MKKWRQTNKKRIYMMIALILCTTVVAAEMLVVQLAYYDIYLDSDLAGHFLSSVVALKERTLIPRGYNHSSALGFESHIWLMPLFLVLFKNIKEAAIASNLLMLFFFLLSSYMFFRSFKINKKIAFLYSLFSIMPLNLIVVGLHIMSQFYFIQLAGVCITIGLFNYVVEEKKIWNKVVLCSAGG